MGFRLPSVEEVFYGSNGTAESIRNEPPPRYPMTYRAHAPPQHDTISAPHNPDETSPTSFALDPNGFVHPVDSLHRLRIRPLIPSPGPPDGEPMAPVQRSSPRLVPNVAARLSSEATFIEGTHLATTPRAKPYYDQLRAELQSVRGGSETIQRIEHPPHRNNDATVLTTQQLKSSQPFFSTSHINVTEQYCQNIVSFSPHLATVLPSGELQSAMVGCYHQLTHAKDNLDLPTSQLQSPWLEHPHPLFMNLAEQSAIVAENMLAQKLNQGMRHFYGPTCDFEADSFSSTTPVEPSIAEFISSYRNRQVTFNELLWEFHRQRRP